MLKAKKLASGRWQQRVRLVRGKTDFITESFRTQREADAWAVATAAAIAKGTHVDSRRDSETVLEAAWRWVEVSNHARNTQTSVASMLKTHLAGTKLAGRKIAEVRSGDCKGWAKGLRAKGLAPGSTRNVIVTVGAVFALALEDDKIGKNPMAGVELPKTSQRRLSVLTAAEVERIAAAMAEIRPQCEAMIVVAARQAPRPGELLGLRVEDADMLRHELHVMTQRTSGSTERKLPKGGKTRTVVLADEAGQALAAHLATYPPGADGTVFTTDKGVMYSPQSYGRYFAKAVKLAGIEPRNVRPDGSPKPWGPHDLRHYAASVWVWANVPYIEIAAFLGHSSTALIESTYSHLRPQTAEQARRRVQGIWAQADRDAVEEPATGTAAAPIVHRAVRRIG